MAKINIKKSLLASVVLLAVVLVVSLSGFFYAKHLKNIPSSEKGIRDIELTQEEIAGLARPSIVRVAQKVTGKVAIAQFDVGLEKMEIIPLNSSKKEFILPPDEIYGSGSIINKDGYILTNSHVVSQNSYKLAIASKVAESYLEIMEEDYLSGKLFKDKNQDEVEEIFKKLYKDMIDYLINKSEFDFKKEVVVLRPNSNQEKMADLIRDGFRANVVSVNDNFYKDNKDVALIKIDETDLPALKIGDSDAISVGNNISIMGFPASAEFNYKNLLEPTFTSGTINAIKDSDNKDFKIFQTDAKISQGSSGGPVLNKNGELIGIITYQSNEYQRQTGDNFAFGIPINLMPKWINDFLVSADLNPLVLNSGYSQDRFIKGLQLADIGRCKKAIVEFEAISKTNDYFINIEYVGDNINKCREIIGSGKSIDTRWDEIKDRYSKIEKSSWIVAILAAASVMLIILLTVIVFKRIKRDEKEIHHLEEEVDYLEESEKKN